MFQFEKPVRLVGVRAAEIRVRLLGPTPAIMAKFAFMTDDDATAGQYVQHSFSSRTQKILAELVKSMEIDAGEALQVEDQEMVLDDDPVSDGPTYP